MQVRTVSLHLIISVKPENVITIQLTEILSYKEDRWLFSPNICPIKEIIENRSKRTVHNWFC